MKSLTMIVQTDDEQELTKLLRSTEQINGFSLSHISGHGSLVEQDSFLAARDQVVGSSPRLRADILVQDADLDIVLNRFANAKAAASIKDVYYWVSAIEQEGHL